MMAWKQSLVTVVAVMAAEPRRPAADWSGRHGGNRPAGSVTWAVCRDVTSLDPVCAFGYLETPRIG